ncbi:MAG: hypothetical protein WC070_00325 [Candidatus Magasanikbacteria bacterium]
MVLPNYKFEKENGEINGIPLGVKIRGSEPKNDNDNFHYVKKLFLIMKKIQKNFMQN